MYYDVMVMSGSVIVMSGPVIVMSGPVIVTTDHTTCNQELY